MGNAYQRWSFLHIGCLALLNPKMMRDRCKNKQAKKKSNLIFNKASEAGNHPISIHIKKTNKTWIVADFERSRSIVCRCFGLHVVYHLVHCKQDSAHLPLLHQGAGMQALCLTKYTIITQIMIWIVYLLFVYCLPSGPL